MTHTPPLINGEINSIKIELEQFTDRSFFTLNSSYKIHHQNKKDMTQMGQNNHYF
jgi:hypothetical protein